METYWQSKDAKAFADALEATVPNGAVALVNQSTSANGQHHTRVHEQIAVDLARWIPPRFAVFVSGLVLRYANGEVTTEASQAAAQEVATAVAPKEPIRAAGLPAALLQWWSKRDEGPEAIKGTGADLKTLTGNTANCTHFIKLNNGINHTATGRTTEQLRVEAQIKRTPGDRMQTPNLCLVAY